MSTSSRRVITAWVSEVAPEVTHRRLGITPQSEPSGYVYQRRKKKKTKQNKQSVSLDGAEQHHWNYRNAERLVFPGWSLAEVKMILATTTVPLVKTRMRHVTAEVRFMDQRSPGVVTAELFQDDQKTACLSWLI